MPSGAKIQLTIDADSRLAETNLKKVQAEASKTAQQISKLDAASSARYLDKFEDRLKRNADAVRMFGDETGVLKKEQQMLQSEIQRLIKRGFDPLDETVLSLKRRFDENRASLSAMEQQMYEASRIENFEESLRRSAVSAQLFGDETEVLRREQSLLRTEIESLISGGMDPLDTRIVQLKSRYDANAKSLGTMTTAKRSYAMATRTATAVSQAFLRTVLPFASAAMVFGSATRFISESGDAFEKAEAQAQKFAITYQGIEQDALSRVSSLAQGFGYARSTMMGILAETGDILTGFGLAGEAALDLTERATYLGAALAKMSPNIGDATLATGDLTKLMGGEGEAMKKWGVVVQEAAVQAKLLERGQKDLTGQSLLQAKAIARLDIAYEQSKNALKNVSSEMVLAADVNRRYNEAWKERKEIVGQATTNFFSPIKLMIAEQIEKWNEATLAKQNYDAALQGQQGSDLDSALDDAQTKVATLRSEVQEMQSGLAQQESAAAKRVFNPWADNALATIRNQLYARQIELDAAELELSQIEDRIRQRDADQLQAAQEAARLRSAEEAARSSSQLASTTEEIDRQFLAIEKLADAHGKAGIALDMFAEKQIAARKGLENLVDSGVVDTEHLDQYIERYRQFLADVAPEKLKVETISYEEITGDLEKQISLIDRLEVAYGSAGGTFDAFSRKQSVVAQSFEQLAQSDLGIEHLQAFIAEYRQFLDLGDETVSIAEVLGSVDEAAFNLRMQYARMGIELTETEAKTRVLEEQLALLSETGRYTQWELYQIELALRSLQETADTDVWEELRDALSGVFSGILEDAISALATGEFSLEDTFSSVISGGAAFAKTVAPQFAWAISLAEGAVQGLNKAIFATIDASREAQATIREQYAAVRDLFLDVLDMEEELAEQRIDAIREQMDLLKEQHDLEMEILRDRWQRGEITGEQYFSEAMAANTSHRDEQESYERQSQLIEGITSTIATLKDELGGLSGWTKFWTQADEKLEREIGKYERLLSAISSFDGLSEDEVASLAKDYGISIPGAARGADFVTSGPGFLAVGDNPGGKEHVQITPLSSYNAYGPSSASGNSTEVHIHITGDVYGVDDLYARLDAAGKRLRKLGRISA
jgi:hypothetical protein